MGLRNTFFQLTLLLVCAVLALNVQAQDDQQNNPVELPRGTIKKLDNELIPAIKAGNKELFATLMMRIVDRSDNEQLDLIEDYCKPKGIGSVRSLFTDAVLEQVAQGAAADKLKLTSSIYVLDEIVDRANEFFESINQHSSMAPSPALDDWSVSEEMFTDIESFKVTLEEAQKVFALAEAILAPHQRKIRASQDLEKISTAKHVEQMIGKLATTFVDVLNREGELRWIRLQSAAKTLKGQGDFEKKLKAAMALEMDAETLLGFLNETPERFLRAPLNGANFAKDVISARRSARKDGGEISQKAILFLRGMEQWRRGRYGIGPMNAGLLKAPEAMNSEAAMQNLSMPGVHLYPINEYYADEGYTPGYERRHYYSWAVEYREWAMSYRHEDLDMQANWNRALREGPKKMLAPTGLRPPHLRPLPIKRQKSFAITSNSFLVPPRPCPKVYDRVVVRRRENVRSTFRAGFVKADLTIPYRLVGSYEYMDAIESLESLVRNSTSEQIKVYNKILEDQKEFAIFSGVASKIGLNPVGQLKGKQIVEFEKSFKKQSLQWMLALARVELGATMSMYGSVDSPFVEFAPENFGAEEYWLLLMDDLNAHIQSMSKDKKLAEVTKRMGSPNSDSLAYLRRFKLINDMLKSAEVGGPDYAYRSKQLQKELDGYREKLVTKILVHTVNMQRTGEFEETTVITRCADMASRLHREQTPQNR